MYATQMESCDLMWFQEDPSSEAANTENYFNSSITNHNYFIQDDDPLRGPIPGGRDNISPAMSGYLERMQGGMQGRYNNIRNNQRLNSQYRMVNNGPRLQNYNSAGNQGYFMNNSPKKPFYGPRGYMPQKGYSPSRTQNFGNYYDYYPDGYEMENRKNMYNYPEQNGSKNYYGDEQFPHSNSNDAQCKTGQTLRNNEHSPGGESSKYNLHPNDSNGGNGARNMEKGYYSKNFNRDSAPGPWSTPAPRRSRSPSREKRSQRSWSHGRRREKSRSRSCESGRSKRGKYRRTRSRSRGRDDSGSRRSRKRERSSGPHRDRSRDRRSFSGYRSRSGNRGPRSGYQKGSPPWDRRSGRFGEGKDFIKPAAFCKQLDLDRKKLIEKWRMNNCDTQDEMQKRLREISQMNPEEILEEENKVWIRSAPADRYYVRDETDLRRMKATPKLEQLCEKFKYELLERGARVRASQTLKCPEPMKPRRKLCKHISQSCGSSSDSDSEESNEENDDVNEMMEELHRKQQHPYRLHREIWYNDPGEMNDGPLCRCSAKARRSGIRHGFYPGEGETTRCDKRSNNAGSLYHYRITISPPTNFLTRTPTIINHDDHEFIFEGFSLISHYPIQKLPVCKVIRFNIEYIILYVEEKLPDNFTIEEVDLFHNYLFKEILELVDFDLTNPKNPDSCPQFHFMPRFVRELPENGRELLPMCEVLKYLLSSNKKLIEDNFLEKIHTLSKNEWQNFADFIKGMVVTIPGMKPCSLRVDQLDRESDESKGKDDVPVAEEAPPAEEKSGSSVTEEEEVKKVDFAEGNEISKNIKQEVKSEIDDFDEVAAGLKKVKQEIIEEEEGNEEGEIGGEEEEIEIKQKNIKMEEEEEEGEEGESREEKGEEGGEEGKGAAEDSGAAGGDEGEEEKSEEKDSKSEQKYFYPEIVHFGIRPPQISYAGNPEYQKAWREYVKFRHLLANMPKPTSEDKQKLAAKENRLQSMRSHSKMKRDVTITVSSKGFYLTGLMCDIVQHAMLIPVLVCHLRFHRSLCVLEEKIGYKFQNRFLLQLALTHPSYRENFGTNPDHARNSLANCGIRQPEYGDRRVHYMNTRKRGINTLISIMSRFGKKNETQSNIYHNERLEFLGDAVVEFITSIHLFHIFRDLEEGGLATYRAALVQNQHLAVLARKLKLDEFMLYAHGSDLCHDLELKHAMANCFEALMGALFLDGGIEVAGKVFGETLYGDDEDCLDVWFNYSPHPLQEQEPLGDRRWISQFPFLKKLTEFEESIGIEFKHIRLLARAFTDRSIGYTNLTLGSNQRLEFLGDSVLQLIASDYLYKYFPEHHEGHLSLLRSSLVNNKTQAVVCDDLGMTKYAIYANPKVEMKIKDRADLLEAFLAALYVDGGLEICRVFCDVCFFPRLQDFIMNQDWNDPKSKLQQCCLTQRTMDGGEPDIPVYKVVECKGPTNTRVYTVAVYFRNKRLAKATGHSIQQAEMNAAQKAMEISGPLFPQLDYQKRVIAKSLKSQKWPNRKARTPPSGNQSGKESEAELEEEDVRKGSKRHK